MPQPWFQKATDTGHQVSTRVLYRGKRLSKTHSWNILLAKALASVEVNRRHRNGRPCAFKGHNHGDTGIHTGCFVKEKATDKNQKETPCTQFSWSLSPGNIHQRGLPPKHQTRQINQRTDILTVLEAGNLKPKCQQGWIPPRLLSLGCRWLSFPRVLTPLSLWAHPVSACADFLFL